MKLIVNVVDWEVLIFVERCATALFSCLVIYDIIILVNAGIIMGLLVGRIFEYLSTLFLGYGHLVSIVACIEIVFDRK